MYVTRVFWEAECTSPPFRRIPLPGQARVPGIPCHGGSVFTARAMETCIQTPIFPTGGFAPGLTFTSDRRAAKGESKAQDAAEPGLATSGQHSSCQGNSLTAPWQLPGSSLAALHSSGTAPSQLPRSSHQPPWSPWQLLTVP